MLLKMPERRLADAAGNGSAPAFAPLKADLAGSVPPRAAPGHAASLATIIIISGIAPRRAHGG